MCLQTDLLAQDQNRSRKIYSSCFHFRQVWRHLIRLLKLTIQAINIRFWIVGSGHTFFFLPAPLNWVFIDRVLVLQCLQACTCFKNVFFYTLLKIFQLSLAYLLFSIVLYEEEKIKMRTNFSSFLWLNLWKGQLCFYSLWILWHCCDCFVKSWILHFMWYKIKKKSFMWYSEIFVSSLQKLQHFS